MAYTNRFYIASLQQINVKMLSFRYW